MTNINNILHCLERNNPSWLNNNNNNNKPSSDWDVFKQSQNTASSEHDQGLDWTGRQPSLIFIGVKGGVAGQTSFLTKQSIQVWLHLVKYSSLLKVCVKMCFMKSSLGVLVLITRPSAKRGGGRTMLWGSSNASPYRHKHFRLQLENCDPHSGAQT